MKLETAVSVAQTVQFAWLRLTAHCRGHANCPVCATPAQFLISFESPIHKIENRFKIALSPSDQRSLFSSSGSSIMLKLDKNGLSICHKRAKQAKGPRNRLINAQSFNKSIEKNSAVI